SCKSNLAVSLNAARAVVIAGANHTGKVPDTAPAANVTHNGSINGKTSTSSGVTAFHDYATDAGTNNFWPTGTLNVSGVNVAGSVPLVAPDRNALKWAVTRGQAESLAGLKTVLLRSVDWTDANYDPAAANKVPALLTWVRDGFVTTHAPFENAGNDGVTIGAMPYSAVAAGPTIGASPPTTIVHGGSLNLPIVNADAGDRTVAIIQGAVTLPLAETGGTNSNIIVPTVTLEQVDPLTSMRRVFDTQATNAVIRVTRTSDSATVDHPIRVIDPVNQTHGNPIVTGGVLTSVPPWIVGDQLQARGLGGGALPADFTIYGDGNVGASAAGNFEYRVYDSVTNTVGEWALATVSVGVAPSITVQPTNQTVSEGATATFSVTATGDAPLTYQWQKNFVDIVGATSATYVTPATVLGDNGSTYRCRVTNAYGSVNSNTATLTVSAVSPGDIIPPSVPTGLVATVIDQTRVHLSWNPSTDTGGSGLSGYRIYRNGFPIGSSPVASLVDSTIIASGSYTYQVSAFDYAGNESDLSLPPVLVDNLQIIIPQSYIMDSGFGVVRRRRRFH
ncbi:MAG: immunoglobulin domain-containing protein, partial [Anaerolineae bacterium]|nr:immunoglobulin domain-containing protein [Anaerolineae bacterium]